MNQDTCGWKRYSPHSLIRHKERLKFNILHTEGEFFNIYTKVFSILLGLLRSEIRWRIVTNYAKVSVKVYILKEIFGKVSIKIAPCVTYNLHIWP